MQTAKLFKNGRSQAVRLPKEFRFDGDEVYVRREGRSIVLSPKDQPKENPWQDFFDALDSFDPPFKFVRDQPRHQQKRASIENGFRGARSRASHVREGPARHRHHTLSFLSSRPGSAASASRLCRRRCRRFGDHGGRTALWRGDEGIGGESSRTGADVSVDCPIRCSRGPGLRGSSLSVAP